MLMGSGCMATFDHRVDTFKGPRQTGVYTLNPKTGKMELSGPIAGDNQRQVKSTFEVQDLATYGGHAVGAGLRDVGNLLGAVASRMQVNSCVDVYHPYTPPMVYTTYYPLFSTGNCRQNYQPAPRYCPPPRIPHPIYGAGRGPG